MSCGNHVGAVFREVFGWTGWTIIFFPQCWCWQRFTKFVSGVIMSRRKPSKNQGLLAARREMFESFLGPSNFTNNRATVETNIGPSKN